MCYYDSLFEENWCEEPRETENLGKTVFLSREEAEDALERMGVEEK